MAIRRHPVSSDCMTVYETSFYCIRIVFLLYFAVNDRWYYLVLRPVDLVIEEHFKQMFQCKNFQEFKSLVLREKNNNRLFSSQFANFKWSNCPNEIMLTAFNIIWTDGYFRFQPKNIQLSKLSTHMSSKSTGKRNRFWWPKIKNENVRFEFLLSITVPSSTLKSCFFPFKYWRIIGN